MKKLWIGCLLLMQVATVQAAEPLAVGSVQYREVAQTYRVDGLVEAVRQSTVSAQIGGRVKEINFDVGDDVDKGRVLVRIDEREAVQALAGSQALVFQAQASVHNAKAAYERARQLFDKKFISQAAFDKAQVDYKVALAQAAASEASSGQASLAHGYTAVLAPYSGVVAARLVEIGEMVMPGKPLMTGFDPTEMRVVVSVPQARLEEIGAHPDALVEVPAPTGIPGGSAATQPASKRMLKPASITIQPVADARTHSTPVRVYLPKNETGVYPGMFVQVHFVVGKANKLVIPASAVLRRSEVVAVYVVDEEGAVKLRQVRLGEAISDDAVEVLAGLNRGEKLALDPVKAGMLGVKQE